MGSIRGLAGAAIGIALFATACAESGSGGREIAITQKDDGCEPGSVQVTGGEKLQLVVTNASDQDVYEVEGIEGTKVEEFVVPSGKTRKAGYTVPEGSGTYKLKCYVPTGVSTIIELVAGDGATGEPTAADSEEGSSSGTAEAADDTVNVSLTEYRVTADKETVASGAIKFVAENISPEQVHELAVLKKRDDGTFDNEGEIEDIAAGAGGEVVLDLEPGDYELACLIAPGEAGSTVDHYAEGMHIPFTVTE